jgi:HAMP domain-containing protein
MLSRGLECFRKGWNTFVQGSNAFDRVGIPLYSVEILSRGLECILEGWNAIDRVGTLSTELERFRQSWNTFVQG